MVATTDGQVLSGLLKSETAESLQLVTPQGQMVTIALRDIDQRASGPSAMPDNLLQNLSKTELRDLIEYLAALR